MSDALTELLHSSPVGIDAPDVRGFWELCRERTAELPTSGDRAVIGGFLADRAGYAMCAGYQASVRVLAPDLDATSLASFCATEPDGNRPRNIKTRLAGDDDGGTLTGRKKWATFSPVADVLFVVASTGEGADGRNRLKVARVAAGAPGLSIQRMDPPPFMPEVPHAELELCEVPVSALLPGDGYADFVKPFRTVEDAHVQAALLGYVAGVARRAGWPQAALEQIATLVVAAVGITERDPRQPETHIALAGLYDACARLHADTAEHWKLVDEAERERWERDTIARVAGKARDLRRQRAWERLAGGGHDQNG